MGSKGLELFGELFSHNILRCQKYWTTHYEIIRNEGQGAERLGTFSALISERIHFFKQEPDVRNGLLLVLICNTAWSLIRTLTDIQGDERTWFRNKHAQFDDDVFLNNWADAVQFMEHMHQLYELQTFLRHPSHKLREYSWVFLDRWPDNKIDMVLETAENLSTVISLAYHEFSIGSGWEGDHIEKQKLHTTAARENA